jgi:hypothetical protein
MHKNIHITFSFHETQVHYVPVRRNMCETNLVTPHTQNHFSINYFNTIQVFSFPVQYMYISEPFIRGTEK